MEKTINRTAKKAAVIITAIVMAIAFMPAFTQDAHAGGGPGVDLDKIIKMEEANGDKSVSPKEFYAGATLSVSMSDLLSQMSDFQEHYNNGEAEISFCIYDDAHFNNRQELNTEYYNGEFTAKLKLEHVGKYCVLETSDELDTGNNNNSSPTKVLKKAYITEGPSVSGVQYYHGLLKKKVIVNLTGYCSYYTTDRYSPTVIYSKKVKLYSNGKLVSTKKTSGNKLTFKNVPVKYKKSSTVTVKIFVSIFGKDKMFYKNRYTILGDKIGKNTVYATKISKNKAIVRWSGAQYANKYRVYKGSKLIKTVKKSKRKCVIKKKGAGNGKYRVIPIYKSGKKVCKGTSSKVKAQKNQVRYSRSTYYGSAPYATCPFVVTKISLKGKTYTVTGYALNNRIFNMSKYSRLTLKLRVEGKKAFSKTFRNLHVGAKDESSKKIVLRIKGRAGADLAHGGTSLSISEKPYWTWGGRHIK